MLVVAVVVVSSDKGSELAAEDVLDNVGALGIMKSNAGSEGIWKMGVGGKVQ